MPINRLRVATFNIQHALAPSGEVDNDLLAESCASLDADILALQEVDVGVPRSGSVDQARLVADATGLHAVFGAARPLGPGAYGNALLAGGPATDVEIVPLPSPTEARSAVVACVGGLSIAATHLSYKPEERPAQLRAVLEVLEGRPRPRILLGDLNQCLWRLPGYRLARGWPTFPVNWPRRWIDHVAVAGLRIERTRVVRLPVSDHRALVVTVMVS